MFQIVVSSITAAHDADGGMSNIDSFNQSLANRDSGSYRFAISLNSFK